MKYLIVTAAALALAACSHREGRPLAPGPVFPEPAPAHEPLPQVTDCADPDVFPEGDLWAGTATAVIDGDSFCMGDIEVRLRRFDAPEWDEPGGPEAREALSRVLSAAGELACEGHARSYDRVIATCRLADGRTVEAALRALSAPRGGGQ